MVKSRHGETGQDGAGLDLTDTWLKANNGKQCSALDARSDRDGLGVHITPSGIERSLNEDRYSTRLADLKHSQRERRASIERERSGLSQRQQQERIAQQRAHRGQREDLRSSHRPATREVRTARQRNCPTGLAAFFGRVSGAELIRKTLHRYEDGKRLKAFQEQRSKDSMIRPLVVV